MKAVFPVALIALSFLCGCSGGVSHPNRIASITISPASATLAKGQTLQFSGTATTNGGQTLTGSASSASWSSSNTAVATIDQNGLATAVAAGTATISATIQTGSGPVSGQANLSVTPAAVTAITVAPANPSSSFLLTGQTQQLAAKATYSDGSISDITSSATWTSQSPNIAEVSASGMVTAIAAGQAAVTASISGITGATQVTVKNVSSVSVAPQNLTLWLNASQQFDAVAEFTDGSAGDITTSVQWTSSVPLTAAVSATGVVQGLAAGNATITASIGSVSASAPLTVSTSNSGVTLVDDLTDSRLMMYQPGDGSVLTFYGTRNSDGTTSAITAVKVTGQDQQAQLVTFDSQERPSAANMADGTEFAFDWSSPSGPVLSAISADRTMAGAITLQPIQGGTTNSVSAQRKAPIRSKAEAATSTLGPDSAVYAHVTSCNGTVPEDNAFVSVTKSGIFGGDPVRARSLGPATGEYEVNLPSGPTYSDADQGAAAAALALVCQGGSNLQYSVSRCNEWPNPYAAAGCYALLGTLTTVCKAQTAIHVGAAVINFLNSHLSSSVDVIAQASLNGVTENKELTNQPPTGPYQGFEFTDFPCTQVDHVNVTPSSATLAVGQSQPLTATAVDANSKILNSSSLVWNWSSSDAFVTVGPGGIPVPGGYIPSGGIGVSEVNITGVSPTTAGSPDNIAATVKNTQNSSSKQGTAGITVAQSNYRITTLPPIPGATHAGNPSGLLPAGINDSAEVVGNYLTDPVACPGPGIDFQEHGFLYSGGSYTTIDPPNACETAVTGINNNGQAVGYFAGTDLIWHAFIYSGGSYTLVDNLPSCPNDAEHGGFQPAGINDSGEIVGTCDPSGTTLSFVYSGRKFTPLSGPPVGPPGENATFVTGINDSGQIIGQVNYDEGFIYDGNAFTVLSLGEGWVNPISIASGGQILASFNGSLYVYSSGSFTPITLPINGADPVGINKSEQIVGGYIDSGSINQVFIATPQ